MEPRDILKELMVLLDKKGFIIAYYTSFSTSSCYIKLDYGLANSIRIANHKGIEKYKYRYNLMVDLDKTYEEDGRMYYCLKDIDKLIKDSLSLKEEKQNRYGFKYFEYMLENKKNKDSEKGFWQHAKLYNDEMEGNNGKRKI